MSTIKFSKQEIVKILDDPKTILLYSINWFPKNSTQFQSASFIVFHNDISYKINLEVYYNAIIVHSENDIYGYGYEVEYDYNFEEWVEVE